jgi:hypothetical protein
VGTKGTSRGGKGAEASRGHLTIAIVAIVAVAIWLAVTADPWQSWSHDGFWEMDRPLADPAALYAGGEFNVYTTTAPACIPGRCPTYWVPRFTSSSLSSTAGLRNDAMPARPAWVDARSRSIWAPSVIQLGRRYVMYFSATAGHGHAAGKKCIGTAASPSPAGPFLPLEQPLMCGPPGYWALDPYVVSDGVHLYLLWREDDAAHVRGKIVGAQLANDGMSFQGATKRTLMAGEFPWEDGSRTAPARPSRTGRRLPPDAGPGRSGIGPIENPAMARHPDTGQWLLTWSANRWDTQDYATGLAVCRGPLGPCERRSREKPWLHTSRDSAIETSAEFGGAGGLSFVTGPDQELYAIFHAYRGTNTAAESARIGWAYRVDGIADSYELVEF